MNKIIMISFGTIGTTGPKARPVSLKASSEKKLSILNL